MQVVPQLLHFQLHELRPNQQVAVETLTSVTETGAGLLLSRAAAAVVLLTVHTDMLTDRQTDSQGEKDSLPDVLHSYNRKIVSTLTIYLRKPFKQK